MLAKKNNTSWNIKFHHRPNIKRIFFKLSGLLFIWLVMAFLYWLLPVYDDKLFYEYFQVLKNYWWCGVLFAIVYFILMDSITTNPDYGDICC